MTDTQRNKVAAALATVRGQIAMCNEAGPEARQALIDGLYDLLAEETRRDTHARIEPPRPTSTTVTGIPNP